MKHIFKIVFLFSLFFQFSVYAQIDKFTPSPFTVKSITEKIKIDGILDESTWKQGQTVGNFWQYFPKDSVRANHQTEIFMATDDKTLYIAA